MENITVQKNSWFELIGIPAIIELGKIFENERQHYVFSLLNPEE